MATPPIPRSPPLIPMDADQVNRPFKERPVGEIFGIYQENSHWFDDYMSKQRALAKERFTKEVHRKQFANVYKYEPSMKKKPSKP